MKRWFAMATQFTRDPKVQALGEELGPGAPLVLVVLLGQAKIAGDGGRVEATYRDVAHDAFIEASAAEKAIELAAQHQILVIEAQDERSFTARFPNWRRYQDSFRKQEARDDGGLDPPLSADGPQLSAPDPQGSAVVRLTGQDNDKDKTTTEPKTTAQKVESPLSPSLQPLVATFNRVVDAKRARPLKLAVWAKCAEKFADRDLALEAEKFEHYWLAGAGQNRALKDVAGAWRNWLRNAPPAGVQPFGGRRYSATERAVELLSKGAALESSATEIAT